MNNSSKIYFRSSDGPAQKDGGEGKDSASVGVLCPVGDSGVGVDKVGVEILQE